MNVAEFIDKWRRAELTERSAAQQHFLDLCDLLDHPKPAEVDPKGEFFAFEKGATKRGGSDGWADIWKKDYFAWEYKGRHKDFQAAYLQLDQYRAALENPPLLASCDKGRIVVHTNFTATKQEIHEIPLEDLGELRNLEILPAVFHAPQKLKPGSTSEAVTAEATRRVAELAVALRERGLDPLDVAHFLDRAVFSFFAEDVDLLPGAVVTRLLELCRTRSETFSGRVRGVFGKIRKGGRFPGGIRRLKGSLFEMGPLLLGSTTSRPLTTRASAPSASPRVPRDPTAAKPYVPPGPTAHTRDQLPPRLGPPLLRNRASPTSLQWFRALH